jgi:uncharacterized membrane protein
MTKVIVVSFKEEAKAIKAFHKLIELESFGDISIYEKLMVRKKANGEYETLKEDESDGWRTVTGMTLGGLVGLLGGPVGFVIGLVSGTFIGGLTEIGHYDFEADFVSKVEKIMPTGEISIIAEIDENSAGFIDSYLQPFDAFILRSDVDIEFGHYVNDELNDIEDDIAESRAELKKSVENEKKSIEKRIEELKKKRKMKIAEFETDGKNAIRKIKDDTKSTIENVKSESKQIGDKISESVKENKENSLKRRIAMHEEKLKNLKMELKEVQV